MDIIAEAVDKLAMGRNCKTVKHCCVAGCDFATTGVCRVHGEAGHCATSQNALSYAWTRRVCKDPLTLDTVLLARNAFADKAAQDEELRLLALPAVTEEQIKADYIKSISGGV